MLKKFLLATFLAVAFILGSLITQNEAATPAQNVKGDLKIAMLNIGFGDSILIQTGKQTILIDAADVNSQNLLIKELENFSVTRIDKLIITHPHIDHIGGAKILIAPSSEELAAHPYLEKISVDEVYDNGITYTSKPYKNYLKALNKKGMTRQTLKTGDTLDFGNGVKFKVIFPPADFVTKINEGDLLKSSDKIRDYRLNNTSIVGKLTYKKFSMMFTGDCEKESEAKIIASNSAKDLKCDVLKGGHHGRVNSSTKPFLAAVNPTYVLMSSSQGDDEKDFANSPPHLKPLQDCLAQGINKKNIFSTRFNGTITIISDGNNFSVTPEIKNNWVDKWMTQKKMEDQKKKQKK